MNLCLIALWTKNIEGLSEFYRTWFDAKAATRTVVEEKGFESLLLTFESGASIELMDRHDVVPPAGRRSAVVGHSHFTFDVGSKARVDELTERMKAAGVTVHGDAAVETEDGYYRRFVQDPDGNSIEVSTRL